MSLMTLTETYSCRATAEIPAVGDAGPLLDAILTELEHDDRVIAPACSYDYDAGRVECTFQIVTDDSIGRARSAFNDALARTDLSASVSGIDVVAGDDPDLLP